MADPQRYGPISSSAASIRVSMLAILPPVAGGLSPEHFTAPHRDGAYSGRTRETKADAGDPAQDHCERMEAGAGRGSGDGCGVARALPGARARGKRRSGPLDPVTV